MPRVIARHLRRVARRSACSYVRRRHELAVGAAHTVVFTDSDSLGRAHRVGAANRQTIVNSDRCSTLATRARCNRRPNGIATPLLQPTPWGVLSFSVYTQRSPTITASSGCRPAGVERHQERPGLERERVPTLRDSLTGLPNIDRLRQFAASITSADGKLEGSCLLFIDVDGLKT
jgi:hypothetical protein